MIKFKGRTIVCDSGVHPAFSGMAALPFLDELDWSTVDAILITHFHLDHAASLTYVMEKVSRGAPPSSLRRLLMCISASRPTSGRARESCTCPTQPRQCIDTS